MSEPTETRNCGGTKTRPLGSEQATWTISFGTGVPNIRPAVYGTKFKIDKKYAPIKALGKGEMPYILLRATAFKPASVAWPAV